MAISKILNMKDCGGHFHGKHLKRSLDYVMNPEKTQDGRLVGAINCQVDSAFEQMKATKRKFGKVDKRQGYHIILSFKEDEVNPDMAFEITRRFVEEYLGKSYEAVYVVHDNTAHVHSHIVFNSVSFVDGKKYRYEKGDWAKYIQPITNKLCQEYGLSIIDVDDGSKEKEYESYKDWSEYREGSFVWADMIKRDLDSCILQAGNYEQFLETYRSAREAGFGNINIDLMSAIPDQTYEGWIHNLRTVAGLDPEHISAYSLIIEQGTPFWEQYGPGMGGCRRENVLPLPDEDTENRIYHLTRDFLGEMGYQRYEISNYAKPGKECRHNIGYWTEVSYLGLGLGASSYMDGCRFSNEKDLRRYLALDLEHDCGEGLRELAGPVEQLSREARMEEFMFLGLRMTRGVSEMDFVRLFGVKMETVYGAVIERLMANGLLKKEGVWLSLTEWGMDVSNFVLSEFLLS